MSPSALTRRGALTGAAVSTLAHRLPTRKKAPVIARRQLTLTESHLGVGAGTWDDFDWTLHTPTQPSIQPGQIWLIEAAAVRFTGLGWSTGSPAALPGQVNAAWLEITKPNQEPVAVAGVEKFTFVASIPIFRPIAVTAGDAIDFNFQVRNDTGGSVTYGAEAFVQFLVASVDDTISTDVLIPAAAATVEV